MSGEVTLRRPEGAPVLREVHGRVQADAERVFAALIDRIEPQVVDRRTRRAVVQGGYWYRGEYAVDPDGDGAAVRLTIVNVAPGWKLLGALTGRGVLRSAPGDFAELLADLSPA